MSTFPSHANTVVPTLHRRRKCPAFGKACLKCNKLNHFASACLSTQKRIDLTQAKLQQESDNEDFFIGVVEQSKQSEATPEENTVSLKVDGRDWFICLQSNASKIRYKMDTRVQANVLPLSTYNQLNIKPILEETNVKLSAYNGGDIPVIGKCEVTRCRFRNGRIRCRFLDNSSGLSIRCCWFHHFIVSQVLWTFSNKAFICAQKISPIFS